MVTFAGECVGGETNGGGPGPTGGSGPTTVWFGLNVLYRFNISNNSYQTISYDLTNLDNDAGYQGTVHWTSGSPSGSLSPGANVSVTCTATSTESGDFAQTMFQAGSAPLLTVGGQAVEFWFHTQGGTTSDQLISLCANNGFSTTVALASQNNIAGNGFNIGLGGDGGDCTTQNICISVGNSGPAQYIPSGSYLDSSSNVSVTLTALCQPNSTPTSVTYNSTDVANIGDISNDNGTLTLVSGSDSTFNSHSNYGPFMPAGSYQNSCSDISVTISADCVNSTGGTNQSTVTYSPGQAAVMTGIANDDGTLTLVTSKYIPLGSYLNTSSNVSVTLTALCQPSSNSTSVTYNSTNVANIGDISNDNGTLTLVSGSDSIPDSDNKYGIFVPAGSYQNSCSDISVTISADCENSTGGPNQSTVTYTQSQAASITGITNNNGTLTIITS